MIGYEKNKKVQIFHSGNATVEIKMEKEITSPNQGDGQ